MTIGIESIISTLKYELESFDEKVIGKKFGTVIESADGLVRVSGLYDSFIGELVEFQISDIEKLLGMVIRIDPEVISIAVFKEASLVCQGMKVFGTNKPLHIQVNDNLLGRVIDPLGNILDDLSPIDYTNCKEMLLESESPGVMERESVNQALHTGICLIDLFNPIGLGQKQLILGDRQTGKTSICLDIILNQNMANQYENKSVYCVYVAIGQKASELARFREVLKNKNALKNSIIVASMASDSAAMQYIAPMVGVAIAEYFRDKGQDSLVILDDLSKHAVAYREICLIMRRTPAREAYPGDVFFLHSRLLERAVNLKNGGSVTILPVIETLDGDVSAYIPTNVISITDGQLYLDKDLFYSGQRPGINIGLSVSRIGSSAQHKNIKQFAGSLKGQLSQYIELKSFAKSVGDLDCESQKIIDRGDKLMKIFKQDMFCHFSKAHMVLILLCNKLNFFDDIKNIKNFIKAMFEFFQLKAEIIEFLMKNQVLEDEHIKKITYLLHQFKDSYFKSMRGL